MVDVHVDSAIKQAHGYRNMALKILRKSLDDLCLAVSKLESTYVYVQVDVKQIPMYRIADGLYWPYVSSGECYWSSIGSSAGDRFCIYGATEETFDRLHLEPAELVNALIGIELATLWCRDMLTYPLKLLSENQQLREFLEARTDRRIQSTQEDIAVLEYKEAVLDVIQGALNSLEEVASNLARLRVPVDDAPEYQFPGGFIWPYRGSDRERWIYAVRYEYNGVFVASTIPNLRYFLERVAYFQPKKLVEAVLTLEDATRWCQRKLKEKTREKEANSIAT